MSQTRTCKNVDLSTSRFLYLSSIAAIKAADADAPTAPVGWKLPRICRCIRLPSQILSLAGGKLVPAAEQSM